MTDQKPKAYKIPTWTCKMVRDRSVTLPSEQLNCFDEVKLALQKLTGNSPVEHFIVFHLNGRNKVVGIEDLAKGGQHGCAITAKDVFRGAIIRAASGIIMGHNHPSGDPTPSIEDIRMTEALSIAADAIGIPLLDHIIVAFNTDKAVSIFQR